MFIEYALKSFLDGQADLTSLISGRLYYNSAPRDVATPYVVMTKISENLEQSLSGDSHLSVARIQFSIFADSYYDTRLIGAQIKSSLLGQTGPTGDNSVYIGDIQLDNETDIYDSYHMLAMDFMVMYNTQEV
ncbi:DUF3168 domain-containing protein [Candidatus Pacearchaeota archaeon]|jgi:hypothetical protein|nr:DUF3168 domain-containing protein [Candidatus Pacearchaeota archaeon]